MIYNENKHKRQPIVSVNMDYNELKSLLQWEENLDQNVESTAVLVPGRMLASCKSSRGHSGLMKPLYMLHCNALRRSQTPKQLTG